MLTKLETKGYSSRDFFIVLVTILLSKSLYYETYGANFLLIPFFFLLAFIIIPNIKNFKVDKTILLYSFSLLGLTLMNLDQSFTQWLVLLIRMLITVMIIHLISFERFSNAFIRIMLILSVISWFGLIIIHYNIQSPLPAFTSVHYIEDVQGRILRNFIFFGVDESFPKYGIHKTSGLWWEPGAFQVFVNLALAFSLINNTITGKRYIIFLITILASLSTTGIVAFSLLSIIYFKKYFKIKSSILYSIPLLALIYGVIFVTPEIYAKLTSFSFMSRYYDVLISIHLFSENIFLGYGYGSQVENARPYAMEIIDPELYPFIVPAGTDGITMFIAQVGILGFIFMIPLLYPKYFQHLDLYIRILISLSLFLIFNTQHFTHMLIFIVLIFYGLVGNKKINYPPKE